MTTVPVAILIQSRHPRARNNYACKNCGDVIPKGTYYEESVVRLGTAKYKDPLVHWRMHSDCQAPWWQPWAPRKLTYFGSMPKRASDSATSLSKRLRISATVKRDGLGHLRWAMPETLAAKIFQSKREDMVKHAADEVEAVLELVVEALLAASGNRKLAMQLSHQFNEIMFLARGVEPPKKRVRKKKVVETEVAAEQ